MSFFNNLGITMSDGINIFLRQVNLYGGFPFEVKLPGMARGNGSRSERREYIRSLCGKYKDSTFSTKRYFKQKRREKELEK
jgi:antitoxin component of RelBE/YafQ-DinJ toxin-antitoxin module